MNKWEESITNNSDKRKLLIESSEFVSKIKLSKGLKESLSMQAGKAGTLIVKNIPVTILDRENLNGRIYSTETMRQAIEEAREAMADKQTLGQANEHPESSFVAPTDASHVIINAYIKENIAIVVDGKKERHNVLFTDWEVLNTTHGKDLRALFEAECSFGTSIRGVGELSGKMVENYSFISVDGVGNPSSSTYTRMPVSESVKVELKDPNELKENYTVMSSSTNVVRDLSQAGILQQQLNANPYGTITKTSTKVDQETDPKTGAQTSITTVEADTEDEVSDLNQAFAMAHKAMTNGISKVNSVTIEANEDEDEQGNKKESVDVADNGLEAYVPESKMQENGYGTNNNSNRILDYVTSENISTFTNGMDSNVPEFMKSKQKEIQNPTEDDMWNVANKLKKDWNLKEQRPEWLKSFYSLINANVPWKIVESILPYTLNDSKSKRAAHTNNDYRYYEDVEKLRNNQENENHMAAESVMNEAQVLAQGQPEGIEFLKTLDDKGRYMFLGRMQADCKYFLDGGNYYNKFLWANSPEKQIEYMKWLYNSFPDNKKPEWISMEEIEDYERQMVGKGKEDHSRDEDYAAESTMNEANEYTHNSLDKKCQKISRILYNVINTDGYTEEEKTEAKQMLDFYGKSLHNFDINNEELFSMFDKLEKDVENKFVKPYVDKFKKITEAKEEQPKDPNEGRQYILKIKDNDPEMTEGSDDAPEFVAMKGNAIRFTKDPKKALHFTQGMEESGIVHYSNIQKLLADMGYGDQNLEKWYKKDNNKVEPKKEGIAGSILGGAAGGMIGHPFIGAAAGSLAQDALVDSKESTGLTEDGNTKYSAIIEIVNKGGLPETKSLPVSSTEMNSESLKKEIANQWKQQEASNDVTSVNKLTLIDNQTQEKFNYDPKTNQLVPENGSQVQQQVQPVEEPKFMDPENVELGVKEESTNGEIEQNDKTLDMDIDDNTHVEKEFDTQAQASVAKAGIESGKLSGDVLLSDSIQPGWYVAHDKIGISGPYETREACMEGLDGYEDQVSVYEVTENDLNEVLFKNPSEPSDDYIEKPLEEESVVESSLVPVRFSNIKWDEKDAAYRMFEDIEKDMQISHIEPDVNNANILVEYFENYINDLKNVVVNYSVNPKDIEESATYQEEIIKLYNEDKNREYPRIESADINLR